MPDDVTAVTTPQDELELAAWAYLLPLLDEVAQVAASADLWRLGDGYGGAILEELRAAAARRGLEPGPAFMGDVERGRR